MYVSIEQIKIGAANYVAQEIASKAVGIKKFFSYGVELAVPLYVDYYADKVLSSEASKIFIDDKKMVNLDCLYNLAKSSIQKSGQFTFLGVIFGETDIDKLYNYIEHARA